jgi:drug/metabolite transporter (DMT)-like permease
MDVGTGRSATLKGILYLIAAVTAFAIVDGTSKLLIATQSFGQVMLGRYAAPLAVLLVMTRTRERHGIFATRQPVLQIARGFMPVIVGGAMVLSVKFLPLADATTILFAGPFIVVALSGALLGENVSPASWIGVALGGAVDRADGPCKQHAGSPSNTLYPKILN